MELVINGVINGYKNIIILYHVFVTMLFLKKLAKN